MPCGLLLWPSVPGFFRVPTRPLPSHPLPPLRASPPPLLAVAGFPVFQEDMKVCGWLMLR